MDGYATMREKLIKCEKERDRARAERNHENTRKLDAVQVACEMRKQLDAALAKLNTLEAAVRAVRDSRDLGFAENMLDILSKKKALYALVPEVK